MLSSFIGGSWSQNTRAYRNNTIFIRIKTPLVLNLFASMQFFFAIVANEIIEEKLCQKITYQYRKNRKNNKSNKNEDFEREEAKKGHEMSANIAKIAKITNLTRIKT